RRRPTSGRDPGFRPDTIRERRIPPATSRSKQSSASEAPLAQADLVIPLRTVRTAILEFAKPLSLLSPRQYRRKGPGFPSQPLPANFLYVGPIRVAAARDLKYVRKRRLQTTRVVVRG